MLFHYTFIFSNCQAFRLNYLKKIVKRRKEVESWSAIFVIIYKSYIEVYKRTIMNYKRLYTVCGVCCVHTLVI